jgi:quercetin dioxygenase-like cupin family protein
LYALQRVLQNISQGEFNMKISLVMSASVLCLSIILSAGAASAAETAGTAQVITRAGTHASVKGSEKFFTGNVRVDRIFNANESAPFTAAYVTFEPGARSFWHTHPAGQHLVVTFGVGRTGTADGKVEEFKAGDVLWCPAGVKHWHGASPTSAMTHIAVTGVKDGKSAEWMEEVTDVQYNGK